MLTAIAAIVAALGPAVVKIVFSIMEAVQIKKENKKKFIEAVIKNSSKNTALELKKSYASLIEDDEWQ